MSGLPGLLGRLPLLVLLLPALAGLAPPGLGQMPYPVGPRLAGGLKIFTGEPIGRSGFRHTTLMLRNVIALGSRTTLYAVLAQSVKLKRLRNNLSKRFQPQR